VPKAEPNLPQRLPFPIDVEGMRIETAERICLVRRCLPVISDYMEPTFQAGGLACIAPADGYAGAGVYVLDDGTGPVLFRAERRGGSSDIEIWHDNPRYSHHVLARDRFDLHCIGRAFAAVNILDRGLLPIAE
jgi:hypothetical protein